MAYTRSTTSRTRPYTLDMPLRKTAYTIGTEGGRIWKIEGGGSEYARQSLLGGGVTFFWSFLWQSLPVGKCDRRGEPANASCP